MSALQPWLSGMSLRITRRHGRCDRPPMFALRSRREETDQLSPSGSRAQCIVWPARDVDHAVASGVALASAAQTCPHAKQVSVTTDGLLTSTQASRAAHMGHPKWRNDGWSGIRNAPIHQHRQDVAERNVSRFPKVGCKTWKRARRDVQTNAGREAGLVSTIRPACAIQCASTLAALAKSFRSSPDRDPPGVGNRRLERDTQTWPRPRHLLT
jgi:hypothetical protein